MFSRLKKSFAERLNTNGLSFRELTTRTIHTVLSEHSIMTRASAIAFSSMMAFVPFLMLVVTVAVRLLPDVAHGADGIISAGQLESSLLMVFPPDVVSIILAQITRLQEMPSLPILSLSIGLSIWTASGLFLEIIDALNRIYGVEERRPWWKLRLTAIAMTMIQCLILFGSLVVIVCWPQIVAMVGLSDAQLTTVTIVKWVAAFLLMLGSFALTFHMGPSSMQSRKWVTPGAIFGTTIFLLASYGFRLYVQNIANYTSAYGPLGGVMMLLFWFWISSLVLLAGAEMNKLAELASTKPGKGQADKEGK